MEYNQDSNQREKVNVNTSSEAFMNSESELVQSTLQVGHWNGAVSLRIHNALPEERRTDRRVFDYDQVTIATLPLLEIAALYAISLEALDASKSNTAFKKGINIGRDKDGLVNIAVVSSEAGPYALLEICKKIDQSRKPGDRSLYIFKQCMSIDNYNAENGDFDKGSSLPVELQRFSTILGETLKAHSNAGVHAYRTVERYYKDKMQSTVNSIAEKNGIDVSSNFSSGNRGGYRSKDTTSVWNKDEVDSRKEADITHGNEDTIKSLM